jgi:dynein heavy chain
LDRELIITYGQQWITDAVFQPNYQFNTIVVSENGVHYQIPDCTEHARFLEYIQTLPEKDNPLIFGLNPNADLTYRLKESTEMINTLVDTQPKEAAGSGGKSREEEVKEKLEKELLPTLPIDFLEADVKEKIATMRGPRGLSEVGSTVPLNVCLYQEIQRFQMILTIVRTQMVNMIDAIEGTIIMTPDLVDAINAVYDFRVPKKWCYDPTGAEISWLTPSLAAWIKGLLDRHHQLSNWITKERPPSFWLTGFFNPQGFLTAMKQEVTRQKKALKWSLDEVEYTNEVQKDTI